LGGYLEQVVDAAAGGIVIRYYPAAEPKGRVGSETRGQIGGSGAAGLAIGAGDRFQIALQLDFRRGCAVQPLLVEGYGVGFVSEVPARIVDG
jgi:hypothetical protein